MTYQLQKPTGANGTNPIPVADNAIDYALYDATSKTGIQLVGRNAIDYGTAVAQNTIQMVSNFAGTVRPNDTISMQGQLWFNATSATEGKLQVRVTSATTGGSTNWRDLIVAANADGDIIAGNITATGQFNGSGAGLNNIPNSALTTGGNFTIGTTNVSLGSTVLTVAGLTSVTATTFYGSGAGITDIPNSAFDTPVPSVYTAVPGSASNGDILVVGAVVSIYASGAWRQVFPAVYS